MIEVNSIEQVEGGWHMLVTVPYARQEPNSRFSMGTSYPIFIPDKVINSAKDLLAGFQI